ncbi:MAG TPA: zinc ribbon domain-containing protein [Gemmatimonadales bacterium]|nr:zinc ribbon domain-containing protein [Gemmatimonadales bacterium]
MDDVERLFKLAVNVLADQAPARLRAPIQLADLYLKIIPYKSCKTVLRFDTNQDYEMALLRLLAGERGYAFVEPEEARVTLAGEAAGVNPDTTAYRRFGSATVTFDPERVREVLASTDALAPPAAAPETLRAEPHPDAPLPWFPEPDEEVPGAEAPEPEAAEPGLPFALDEGAPSGVSPRSGTAPCAFCGGQLPVGRAVIFCPHCGQNVGVVHCPSCGAELDVGWRFCITCGQQMSGLA